MAALNIAFTATEMAMLRDQAAARGVSLKTLVHDTAVGCLSQQNQDARVLSAAARVTTLSRELLDRLAGE